MSQEKKSYNLIIGIAILVVIILIVSIVGYFVSKPRATVIQGQAESTEYRVSGKVPGRVEDIYVKEGSYVHKGDTLVYINSPEVLAKLAQAKAARAAALAQKQKAMNGARKEQITGAFELWQQAIVQEQVMKKSFERIQKLFNQKIVSEQKYDEVKAKYDASVAQSKAAESQYNMATNGARKEDKDAAEALVERANAAIQEVKSYLGDLYLVAPSNGIVSCIFPHVGELVGQGAPIMTITDLNDSWFTFNVRENNLHGFKIGNKITIQIPALDNKECKATINYMSVRESYATWKATKETDSYDEKTFEIKAIPQKPIDGLLPGMSVIVKETKK